MLHGCSTWFQQRKIKRGAVSDGLPCIDTLPKNHKEAETQPFLKRTSSSKPPFFGGSTFYILVFGRSAIRRSKRHGVKMSEGRIVFTFVVLMSPYFDLTPMIRESGMALCRLQNPLRKKGSSSGKRILWHFPGVSNSELCFFTFVVLYMFCMLHASIY